MAKDPGTVKKFLTELGSKLVPLWQEEQSVMLRMKEEEAKELGFEFNGKLNFWDFRYCITFNIFRSDRISRLYIVSNV